MEVEVKPASAEELDAFLGQNRRWIPDDAEKVLRGMSGLDQRRVISGGTMSSVQNPVAVIQARVRKAKELEAAVSRSGGKVPAVLLGLESKLIKPATEEDLDGFIKANDRWLGDEAVQTLRSMSAFDQRRVISAGTMSGCRDPVAVIQTRAKKAREMEMELENLAAGKGPLLKKEKPSQAPAPSFDEEAAAMHLYAPPEEVFAWESRFAPPPIEDEDSALVGESPGVGGVVEILKAKYGCSKGQRIRVIGETHSLLQFEGGKTAPKNHEDSGWKWVIREEEEVKQSAAQAQMAALKQAAAAQLAQVEAAKAAELARAQAEAKAYAAAQQEAIRSKEPKAPRKTRRSSSSSSSSSSETEEKKHRHQKNPKKGIGREKKARSTKAKKNKKEAKSKAATRDALSKSRKTEKKKSEEKRKAKKAAKVKKRKARSSSSSSSATDVTIPGASEA